MVKCQAFGVRTRSVFILMHLQYFQFFNNTVQYLLRIKCNQNIMKLFFHLNLKEFKNDTNQSHLSRTMRKPDFCLCENKGADQLRSITAKLISAFVFATRIVQFLFFSNTKFQASIHLRKLHRPVCVRPGQKPRRPVFSRHGSKF